MQAEYIFVGGISFTFIVLMAFALFCRYMARKEKQKEQRQRNSAA